MRKPPYITIQCIYCNGKKRLTPDEAKKLTGPPMCEKDGGVMLAVEARA